MPSQMIHIKWARLYGISDDIATTVETLLDQEKVFMYKTPISREYVLGPIGSRTLFSTRYTIYDLADVLRGRVGEPKLKEAFAASILHCFLDRLENIVRDYGLVVKSIAKKIIDTVYGSLMGMGVHAIARDELRRVYEFVRKHAIEIIDDIIDELKRRGWSEEVSSSTIMSLLGEYIRKRGFSNIIWIGSEMPKPMNVSAAAKHIYVKLSNGEEVTIQFSTTPNQPSGEKLRFRSLEDLILYLLRETLF